MSFSPRSWFSHKPNTIRRRPCFTPRLLLLEERTLPSTYTVLNLNDSGPGSLRAAIADANGHAGADTINFAPGLHGTIKLSAANGELMITDSVAINGPGANRLTVSGEDVTRVFEIAAGNDVSISGLSISHGNSQEQGGGILNDGSNLTLVGDMVSHNTATGVTGNGRGGGIRSLDGTLTMTNCQVLDNRATGGPADFGDGVGGGIYILAGTASLTNCTISGNEAHGNNAGSDAGAFGGGMEVITTATINGCTFTNNHAVGDDGATGAGGGDAAGGAINVVGSVTVTGCTFDHNQAIAGSGAKGAPTSDDPFTDYAFGGAINAEYQTTITVTNSRFSRNQAIGGNNASAVGTDIVGVGGGEGGAILNEVGASATITGCVFDHNTALGGSGNTGTGAVVLAGEGFGGAIASGYGGSLVGASLLTVSGSSFTGNQATGGDNNTGTAAIAALVGTGTGGAIANYAGGTATISGSALILNVARGGHGNTASSPVAVAAASPIANNALLANAAAGGAIFNSLGKYVSPDADFGPLDASTVSVSRCVIALNSAQAPAGMALGGGIANLVSAATTVALSVLIQNDAGASGSAFGGGAYNDATSSLKLTSTFVTLNRAHGSPGIGGGVYNLGTFTFDAMTFIKFNQANTSNNDVFG